MHEYHLSFCTGIRLHVYHLSWPHEKTLLWTARYRKGFKRTCLREHSRDFFVLLCCMLVLHMCCLCCYVLFHLLKPRESLDMPYAHASKICLRPNSLIRIKLGVSRLKFWALTLQLSKNLFCKTFAALFCGTAAKPSRFRSQLLVHLTRR